MTATLDFIEDLVSCYIGGSGGMEDSVLSVLLRLHLDLPSEACVT